MKCKQTIFIIPVPNEVWDGESYHYVKKVEPKLWPYDSYDELQAIGSVEVEFDFPDNLDHNTLRIEQLEAAKKQLQADFNARVTQIQGQINELLAIEG